MHVMPLLAENLPLQKDLCSLPAPGAGLQVGDFGSLETFDLGKMLANLNISGASAPPAGHRPKSANGP